MATKKSRGFSANKEAQPIFGMIDQVCKNLPDAEALAIYEEVAAQLDMMVEGLKEEMGDAE